MTATEKKQKQNKTKATAHQSMSIHTNTRIHTCMHRIDTYKYICICIYIYGENESERKREYTRRLGDNRPRTAADADPCGPPNHTYYAKIYNFLQLCVFFPSVVFLFLLFLNDNPSSLLFSLYINKAEHHLRWSCPYRITIPPLPLLCSEDGDQYGAALPCGGGPVLRVCAKSAEKLRERERERGRGVVKRLERWGVCEDASNHVGHF
jgi:hypothetical protein